MPLDPSTVHRWDVRELRPLAVEAARRRRELRAEAKAGRMTFADLFKLAQEDRTVARTRVRSVLGWLTGIGSSRAFRIMSDCHVGATRRMGDLTEDDCVLILAHPYVSRVTAQVRLSQSRRLGVTEHPLIPEGDALEAELSVP